jgi:hypothetical protein
MASTLAPFGLRPVFHPSGLDRAQALAGGIASEYSSNIFKGQPITYNAGVGTIVPVTGTVAFSGAFDGVEWTDVTGRRRVSNFWPANTAYQTGSCIAYFYNDEKIVYEVQADGNVAQTALGNEVNFTNLSAGSTFTGLSAATVSSSLAGAGNQGQVRIVDIAPYPDNAWSDGYPILRVTVAKSQFVAPTTAI